MEITENLTAEDLQSEQTKVNEYFTLCPIEAANHINNNFEGFMAGWLARAAVEKNTLNMPLYSA